MYEKKKHRGGGEAEGKRGMKLEGIKLEGIKLESMNEARTLVRGDRITFFIKSSF